MALGVWLVGAGNVGACTLAGWSAVGSGVLSPIGVATHAPPLGRLPLAPLTGVPFGGHEIRGRPIADTLAGLVAEGVLPAAVVASPAVQEAVGVAQAELRPGVAGAGGWDDLARVRDDLLAFRARHELDTIVVLDVASTEAPLDTEAPVPTDPDALFAALQAGLRVPPSVIYAAAAIDLGLGHIGFSPSTGSDLPALHALAYARGAALAGADGKTGQTLLKTVLAPLFAIRQLPITSWVSHNVLGNDDGKTLADPARRAAKQATKSASLAAILGYAPETAIGIEYIPSYGDWKVAWDRIGFTGFGGAAMSLELSWRGSDTSLAAPLCIDLIRLVDLALRRGERGALDYLGVFFKRPFGSAEHRLERQWQALLDHYSQDLSP